MKTAILAILLFCALIFPHELGHFVVAKLCKVQVNEFALGMGPAIYKKQKGETLYALRAIPIGGYCAMEGENEESENPRAFNNKKAWQKILVLVAGSLMNVLLCFIIMVAIAGTTGTTSTTIEQVQKDMPAYGVVQPGDQILYLNDKKIDKWEDLNLGLNESLDKSNPTEAKTVHLTVLRDGNEVTLTMTPKFDKKENRLLLGVVCKLDHNIGSALVNGVIGTKNLAIQMYEALDMLFTGKAGVEDLSGPVGIVTIVGQTSDYGIMYFFYLMAFISLNLAFVNMLPFPALDGGRILFVIIRKLTGKMISDELEGNIHTVGMLLLLALMVYVTWNDIGRLF